MPTASADSSRINAERVVLAGWLRALLLQLAHPLIAAGVARHSTFRGSARAGFSRLRQTIDAMLEISFGTDAGRDAALEAIRVIHRRVNGRLGAPRGAFEAGTPYSAEDPRLVLWVHATLVESILLTYDTLVAPLTDDERDCYCRDAADVAIALGAPSAAVPRTWQTLRVCVADRLASGEIVVGPDARDLAAALLAPFDNWLARHTVTPIAETIAAGQLPEAIREQYGFKWNSRRARRFAHVTRLVRLARGIMPIRLAWWTLARDHIGARSVRPPIERSPPSPDSSQGRSSPCAPCPSAHRSPE